MRRLLLTILLALVIPATAQAQPTLVNQDATLCGSGTTCTADAGIAVNAGDLIVGLVQLRGTTATSMTMGDATNGATAYTCPAGAFINNAGASVSAGLCYFLSSGAATITVSLTADQTSAAIGLSVAVCRTPAGEAWSADQFNEATNASGLSHTHGSITTTGPGCIFTTASQGSTVTDEVPNASFTALANNGAREYWQYRLTTGAVTTDGTYTSPATAHTSAAAIGSFTYTPAGAGGSAKGLLFGVGVQR